jgi:flagellar FliL protein
MADEEIVSQGEKKGLGGLKLIIVVALVVILVGAGGFFLGKMLAGGEDPKEQEASVSGDVKSPDGVEKKDEPTEGNPKDNPEGTDLTATTGAEEGAGLLVLEKFTVNLNDPFGRRYAEILINLKIDRKSLVSRIQQNELILPQIRDEIFMIISSKSYPELNSVAGKVTLKEEIMIRVNELIKENLNLEPVLDVFFGNFIIQ